MQALLKTFGTAALAWFALSLGRAASRHDPDPLVYNDHAGHEAWAAGRPDDFTELEQDPGITRAYAEFVIADWLNKDNR